MSHPLKPLRYLTIYSRYVELKKVGKNYFALCPFHIERHPSFAVNPTTGWYKCFGCGEKGNVFQFLKKISQQQTLYEEDKVLAGIDIPATFSIIRQQAQENTKQHIAPTRVTIDEKIRSMQEQGYVVVAKYEYYGLDLQKKYTVVRFERLNENGEVEKQVIPFTPDGTVGLKGLKQIPYGLHQFVFASPDTQVWIIEGEKCVDYVVSQMPGNADLVCIGIRKASDITNVHGWEDLFAGKNVVLFEDNDRVGRKNTGELIELLQGRVRKLLVVRFTEFGEKYDVADYLAEYTWNDLIRYIELHAEVVSSNGSIESRKQEMHSFLKAHLLLNKSAPENWLLDQVVYRNTISLIDAIGATGKSFLALQLAVSYVTNSYFLLPAFRWNRKNPIAVYITTAAENPPEIVNNRLVKICRYVEFEQRIASVRELVCEYLHVLYVDHLFSPSDTEKELVSATEEYIRLQEYLTRHQVELVIVDPIQHFFLIDFNKNEVVTALYRILQQLPVSWILVHHQAKANMYEDTENTTARGASAFRDLARLRLTMKKRTILVNKKETPVMDLFIEKNNFSIYHQHHIFLSQSPPFTPITGIMSHEEFIESQRSQEKQINEEIRRMTGVDETAGNLLPTRGRKRRAS